MTTLPSFTLPLHDGTEITDGTLPLPAVLFFYPKASTSGCTKEAVAFSELRADFEALGVAVYGISADTVKRQANFVAKVALTVPLIADTERVLIEALGVWQEKKMYGKAYMGIARTTVLIGSGRTIIERWDQVKVAGHAEAVLEAARRHLG